MRMVKAINKIGTDRWYQMRMLKLIDKIGTDRR